VQAVKHGVPGAATPVPVTRALVTHVVLPTFVAFATAPAGAGEMVAAFVAVVADAGAFVAAVVALAAGVAAVGLAADGPADANIAQPFLQAPHTVLSDLVQHHPFGP